MSHEVNKNKELEKTIMAMVKIVTDSNSGITQAEAERLGISVIPMPFVIDGEQYFEDIDLTQAQFYEYLAKDASVSTSQPSTASVTEVWERLLQEGCDVVHIPMSSALSESCHTAQQLAKEYGGRVQVVDNRRISISLKHSVFDALSLAERGMSAKEIARKLEASAADSSIYLTLDTLKYLKRAEGSPLRQRSSAPSCASSPFCRSRAASSTLSRRCRP